MLHMEIITYPIQLLAELLIPFPFIAFLMCGIFAFLHKFNPTKTAKLSVALWFAYGVYETLMKYGYLCPEGCNIRLELFLIYPVLLFVSTLVIAKLIDR